MFIAFFSAMMFTPDWWWGYTGGKGAIAILLPAAYFTVLSLKTRNGLMLMGILAFALYSFRDQDVSYNSNTVYDFKKANLDHQIKYKLSMCNSGNCLPIVDRKCGFGNGDETKVEQCVDNEIKLVEPWEKLDRIAKYCGLLFANFVNEDSSPAECQKAGGQWGVKSTLPPIELRGR